MSSIIKIHPKALRAKDAANYLGIGISTLWRWSSEGRLPRGVRLGGRTTVWLIADLEKFINDRQMMGEQS